MIAVWFIVRNVARHFARIQTDYAENRYRVFVPTGFCLDFLYFWASLKFALRL